MLEDYRAGLGLDREHDEADRRKGRRIVCPVLVLWATGDDRPIFYGDVIEVWRGWADEARGRALACGHHMAEEAPEALAVELGAFLASG